MSFFFIHCIYVLSNLVRHDHFCKFKNILKEFRIFKNLERDTRTVIQVNDVAHEPLATCRYIFLNTYENEKLSNK